MNRRSIFKSFLPMLAAPFLGSKAEARAEKFPGMPGQKIKIYQNWPEIHDQFAYRGWKANWTGWKSDQATEVLAAQWHACSDSTEQRMYVSNPGSWGTCWPESHFDISPQIGQVVTTRATPVEVLNSIKAEMRAAMMRLIDHVTPLIPTSEPSGYYWTCAEALPPAVNPEFGDCYRTCWNRFSPELIAKLKEKESRLEVATSSYKFGFTGFKNNSLEALNGPSFLGFDGGKELRSPLIYSLKQG